METATGKSAHAARAARVLWVMCVVGPLVFVGICGTMDPFISATIFLLVTAVQALRTAPFSRTSTLEALSYKAVQARSSFTHLLVVFSVCTLLL